MSNPDKKTHILPIYNTTGLVALIYSGLMIIFSIYKQFFYIDETWLHGFTANGFVILSNLVWIGILLVFRSFLNNILNYRKADSLLIIYCIFLALTTFFISKVVFMSIKMYLTPESIDIFDLSAFAITSISDVIQFFIYNFVIVLVCIILGCFINNINIIEKKLFKILGFSFIIYGLFSLLVTINIIENDTIQLLLKAVLSALIGLILKKTYSMDSSDLHSLLELEKVHSTNQYKIKKEVLPEKQTKKTEKTYNTRSNINKDAGNKANLEDGEVPDINSNEFENKEQALSYYESLSKEELNRLESIVCRKHNENLTDEQKTNLIIQHIAENKLYDYQRFLPQ